MAWIDWFLGPFDLIDVAIHTIGRNMPTKARNLGARHDSGAVLIRVPHPFARMRKEAEDPTRIPFAVEVQDHLRRNGVRTWHGRYDGDWLHMVGRESQRTQIEWLLSGQLDVTDRDQMRGWAHRWADGPQPKPRGVNRQERRIRRREQRRTK